MVKIVKSVMVNWNTGVEPHTTYFRDMNEASAGIAHYLGVANSSGLGISIKHVVKALNLDNPEDKAWYDRYVGRTITEIATVSKTVQPAKPSHHEPSAPRIVGGVKAGPVIASVKTQLGDTGYATEHNPTRQATGRIGGLAAKRPPAPAPDRRKPGTVNFNKMSVDEKRIYWRWSDARKRARKAGAPVPSWDTWKAIAGVR